MEQQNQPNQLPERVSMPTSLVNEILSVFSGMPYREVAQLITKVQNEVQPLPDIPSASPVEATPRVVAMDAPPFEVVKD